jgi:tetratricopeptide (TPR) repeat protein
MVTQQDLSAGIAAARAGDRARARELFARAVKANPQSEEAWLQLGLVLEERDRREYCFRQVLKINPQNDQARRQLAGSTLPTPSGVIESSEKEPAPDAPPAKNVPAAPATVASPPPAGPVMQAEPSAPAEPQMSEAAVEGGPIGFEKTIVVLLGVVIGLLLCGGPIFFVVQTGRLDPVLPVALVPPFVPTFTSTPPATSTPTRTPTSTPTPPATPTFTKQQRAEFAAGDAAQAETLMSLGSYAEAVAIWDRVIAVGPDNGRPYYRRAVSYLKLLANQRSMTEYVDYLNKALADSDRAIALGPATGDYYLARYQAYWQLSSVQDFRIDNDRLTEIAGENLRMAIALGNSEQANDLDIAAVDLALGRCDVYMATTNRLVAASGQAASPNAYYSSMLSRGYLCQGKLDDALRYIDSAIKQEPSTYRKWTRSIILTDMGRLNGALAQLTEMIDASPYYGGYRYYLRALVYYDLKKPDMAQKDLITGSAQTWGSYGLRSYVLGRMALDAGNRATGIEQLRLAEATITHEYGPLLDRIRRELKQLNVPLLAPTLSIPFRPTPLTIPKAPATPLKPKVKSP